jgi:hypothetical protein
MTRKNMIRLLLLLALLINLGVWLMGVYGLEVRFGSNVLGRHIGINDEESWSSLAGWIITIGATIALIIVLYRNR